MRQYHLFFNRMRQAACLVLALALMLALSGCRRETDPHAGMIEVYNGTAYDWVYPWPGVSESTLAATDFYTPDAGLLVSYTGEGFRAQQGIDVSYFQGDIDWAAVAADGVEFAMIRAGYRGYTDGYINMDPCFPANAQGALDAGLEIGLYFFSQAVTEEEAQEEAQWLLQAASRYRVTLPLVFDWENIGEDSARTDAMLGSEMTAGAAAFCDVIARAGYTPGVYMNRWQGYYDYDLSQLTGAELWVSAATDVDDFYYAHTFWQYTYNGSVDGIQGAVDRDLRFIPVED